MRSILFISIFLLLGCKGQKLPKQRFFQRDLKAFLKQDYLTHKGIIVNQELHCVLNIKTKDGITGYFEGVPTAIELKRKFGSIRLLNTINFCKKNNIYSLEMIDDVMILKTGNRYFTFKELDERDNEYYDNTLKLTESELENETPGLCYILGRNDSIIKSMGGYQKVYTLNDSVHYFWTYISPLIKDCDNGLIH